MLLYHVGLNHHEGDVVPPYGQGSGGRCQRVIPLVEAVLGQPNLHDGFLTILQDNPHQGNFLNEAIFELVRRAYAPERPSRFDCAFCSPTIEQARKFRDDYRRRIRASIYECRLESGIAFAADMDLITRASSGSTLRDRVIDLENRARDYWRGDDPIRYPELLAKGTVRIERVIEEPINLPGSR